MKSLVFFIVLFLVVPCSVKAKLLFHESFENLSSISNNNGTITGTISFQQGIVGKAAYFPSGARVMYSMIDNINTEKGTIEFWVLFPDSNHLGFFDIGYLGNPNSWAIFKNNNRLYMEVKDEDSIYYQTTGPISFEYDGNWHFISCPFARTSTETHFKVCIDGRCRNNFRIAENSNPDNAGEFYIGWCGFYNDSLSQFDEFKIYDHKKSDEEIYVDYKKYINKNYQECNFFKQESNGDVKLNCEGLTVNGKPFTIKGVAYQPIPIGSTAEALDHMQEMYDNTMIRERDFPELRNMNANAIRTWYQVLSESWLDDLFNNGENPIYVLMGFYIACDEDYNDPTVRQKYIDDFTEYVEKYKDHPAVLAWLLGNENNLPHCPSSNQIENFYSLCNELAQVAYNIEGSNYHPTGIVNGFLLNIGDQEYNSDDNSLPYIDFWGVNVYPGESFGSWFENYKYLSGKPLLITEYGIDALDNRTGEEYQNVQSQWVLNQWREINRSDVTIGSTLMEYSDEWWKSGNNSSHDNGGYYTDRHPDGFSNEEWWGIMGISLGNDVDVLEKRQVYYDLQRAWKGKLNLSFIQLLLLEN